MASGNDHLLGQNHSPKNIKFTLASTHHSDTHNFKLLKTVFNFKRKIYNNTIFQNQQYVDVYHRVLFYY